MKILITGANSFIGNNYIKLSKYKDIQEISLIDKKAENIDFSAFDIILHLAAIVHRKEKIPEEQYYKINTELPLQVAQKAKSDGVKQFVFMSTLSVYGEKGDVNKPFTESSECYPANYYGKSKLKAEKELMKLNNETFTISIIRTPLVYGENVIANMQSIIKLVDKVPILPFKNTNNLRSFISVNNLSGYIDKIIEQKSEGIHLVCDQKPLSTTELVQYISKHLNKKRLLMKFPKFLIKLGAKIKPNIFNKLYDSFIVDNKITNQKLNFQPNYSIDKSIKYMVESYKKNKN